MSANPMYGKVFFLATARLSDKVLVASTSYNSKSIGAWVPYKLLCADRIQLTAPPPIVNVFSELAAVKQMLQGLQAVSVCD